jgi:hypothetical protein
MDELTVQKSWLQSGSRWDSFHNNCTSVRNQRSSTTKRCQVRHISAILSLYYAHKRRNIGGQSQSHNYRCAQSPRNYRRSIGAIELKAKRPNRISAGRFVAFRSALRRLQLVGLQHLHVVCAPVGGGLSDIALAHATTHLEHRFDGGGNIVPLKRSFQFYVIM